MKNLQFLSKSRAMTDENNTTEAPAADNDQNELELKVAELEQKLSDAEGAKLRALADLENFRRRESESRATWSRDAVADWVKQIIPSLQELQLGAEHTSDDDIKKVIEKFTNNLQKLGLEKIAPEAGEEINPDFHEVLMTAEGEPGKVVQTFEPGWILGEKVIIPAKISGAPLT